MAEIILTNGMDHRRTKKDYARRIWMVFSSCYRRSRDNKNKLEGKRMKNIQVGEDYRIESDSLNYILKKRHVSDPNHRFSSGQAKETWNDVGYYGKLEHLVHALIERQVRDSDTVNLLDVVRVINEIATFKVSEIKKVLEGK